MYETSFRVDKHLYPAPALLRAAHRFIDQCYLHLSEQNDAWIVSVTSKDMEKPLGSIKDEFENELIIQSVRLSVYQRTRSIREMLLARAMSSSLMVDEQKAHEAYHESDISDDELKQILTDWFEKYE